MRKQIKITNIKDHIDYKIGFGCGRKQAIEEVEKMIDEWCMKNKGLTLSNYNVKELKQKLEKMK